MQTPRTLLAAVCLLSLMACGPGFLMRGSTTLRCRANPLWLRRQHSNLNGLAKLHAAAGAAGDGEVLIRFKPSEVETERGAALEMEAGKTRYVEARKRQKEVACNPGEVVLEVAQRCSGMIEDNKNPFCRDGGCYNCEVEVVEAAELGLEDNLVRGCMFKVPEGAKQLTLIQMSSDEAFEDMV